MRRALQAEFVDTSSPRWVEALAAMEHDVYHLPDYVRLCAEQEGGEPTAFLAEDGADRLLVPLILRPIDASLVDDGQPLFDATSPYGYPSPLLTAEDGSFPDRAVAALLDGLRGRNVVAMFARLNPVLAVPMEPLSRVGTVVGHGETVAIDLRLADDELWRQTRHNHRRHISKAERAGLVVRVDEQWQQLDPFVDLYHDTMRRLDATDYYFFSRQFFRDLREALGTHLHLCVVEIDGRVASAGLFTELNGIVQYHLSGTDVEMLEHHPLKLMLHFMRSWAKARGDRVLHLGGGVGGKEDSLFAFKAGFSESRYPFFTWRVIADELAYDRLIARWETRVGMTADQPDGYFPAYRKQQT